MHHEGLAKAAEEKRDGLAREEPIDVLAQGLKQEAVTRRHTTLIALCRALGDDSPAVDRIAWARQRADVGGHVKSCLTPQTGRGSGDAHAGIVAADIDYKIWYAHMSKTTYGSRRLSVALDIICSGKTFETAGRALTVPVSDKTAKDMAISAVMDYVAICRGEPLTSRSG